MAAPAAVEAVAWGYGLLEGPRGDAEGNLYFADVPNGGVYCRRPNGQIDTVVPKRRGVGGIALHADGGLVVGGRDISHVRDGVTRQLASFAPHGTNDLFTDAQGRVIVGTLKTNPFDMAGERVPGDCWRIEAAGQVTLLYGGIELTNGIGLSPDGSIIYHADTTANAVVAHDMAADGTCGNRRNLYHRKGFQPDGLAVDEAGTVWVAEYGGGCVTGIAANGTVLASIPVPAREVTSVCFAGPERRDLYIVTADNTEDATRAGTIFRTRVDVPGVAVAPARI